MRHPLHIQHVSFKYQLILSACISRLDAFFWFSTVSVHICGIHTWKTRNYFTLLIPTVFCTRTVRSLITFWAKIICTYHFTDTKLKNFEVPGVYLFNNSKPTISSLHQSWWLTYPIYINNRQLHFNIYDLFHSQCSHQNVSAGIPAIFRVMPLLQKYKVAGTQPINHTVNTAPTRWIKTHHITASVITPHRLNNINCQDFNNYPF